MKERIFVVIGVGELEGKKFIRKMWLDDYSITWEFLK